MGETPPGSPPQPQEGPDYDVLQRAKRRAEVDKVNMRRADQGQRLVPYDEERTSPVNIVPVAPDLLAAREKQRLEEQSVTEPQIDQPEAGSETPPPTLPTAPPTAE